jgi:hypothetical protein
MKAINVLNAAKKTYENYGNQEYATSKANNFVRRCTIGHLDDPDWEIPKEIIERVVYAALDSDSSQVFWANLL